MTEMSKRLTPWITDAALLRGNGDFAGQGRLAVRDPATGDLVAQVALSDATGARAAVDAADEMRLLAIGRGCCRKIAPPCCTVGTT
jgi:aspartate-semialdehyde dehydrogenase